MDIDTVVYTVFYLNIAALCAGIAYFTRNYISGQWNRLKSTVNRFETHLESTNKSINQTHSQLSTMNSHLSGISDSGDSMIAQLRKMNNNGESLGRELKNLRTLGEDARIYFLTKDVISILFRVLNDSGVEVRFDMSNTFNVVKKQLQVIRDLFKVAQMANVVPAPAPAPAKPKPEPAPKKNVDNDLELINQLMKAVFAPQQRKMAPTDLAEFMGMFGDFAKATSTVSPAPTPVSQAPTSTPVKQSAPAKADDDSGSGGCSGCPPGSPGEQGPEGPDQTGDEDPAKKDFVVLREEEDDDEPKHPV
jgi:hypothetical protein